MVVFELYIPCHPFVDLHIMKTKKRFHCETTNHGFKNWYGQRTRIESDSWFYGWTRVKLMVELIIS